MKLHFYQTYYHLTMKTFHEYKIQYHIQNKNAYQNLQFSQLNNTK